MLTDERCKEVISLCQNLIRIQSYSGQEESLVEEIKKFMCSSGFDEIHIDSYGSIIGCIRGSRPGKKLLLDGHIDTVTVSDLSKWSFDPFGGTISDNRIYGRGTSDMKGAVSAMLCAAKYLAEDLKKDFSGEIYITGTVHEECFEGVAAKNICEKVKPDIVIIGEASALNIKRGQRGRAEIIIETFGRQAHSANPEKGLNAVYQMCSLIEEIKKLEYAEHDFLGKGILVLTDIVSAPYPGASVVPDYCRCTFDRRLLPGETKESVLKPLYELISNMKQNNPEMNAKAAFAEGTEKCYTANSISAQRYFPAWLLEEDDPVVQTALKALNEVGINATVSHYSFCTNGSYYAGEAGIKTIGFGPSAENLAHTADEYIEIDQLLSACRGYYGIAKNLLV
jgi:putative selenium metabolism hydrolase